MKFVLSASLSSVGILLAAHVPIAQAQDASSPWLVRGGVAYIEPKSHPGAILGGAADVTVSHGIGPTVTLSYFLTPNLAVDVLAGLPFKHDIDINGAKAGSTKHLPPIVSLQYHFTPSATVRPYVGVGVNYTTFLKERLDNGADLKLSSSWGVALQAGVDFALDKNWTVGGDIRYARIATDVKVNGADAGRIRLDPVIFGINVGYRF
jgi:outer membrane protein